MNVLDIVFLIILVFFCARGFFRGIIKEIASIVGLLLGFYTANNYHAQIAPHIEPFMSDPGYTKAAAYLICFFGVMFGVWVCVRIISSILKLTMLAVADHVIGGAFGLVKGGLICAVMLLVLTAFLPKADFVQTSKIAPYIGQASVILAEYLPQDMKDKIEAGKDKFLDLQRLKDLRIDLPALTG